MKETKINVLTKLNNIEENNEFLAVKNNDFIKYIDLENNKMIIDLKNNIITRENIDYLFNMDFNNNIISITMKKLDKVMEKEIKTMALINNNKEFMVRYLLTDDEIINEYYVKF
jgi:3-oxoacyl-[acyl-carrier-protein] synthase III